MSNIPRQISRLVGAAILLAAIPVALASQLPIGTEAQLQTLRDLRAALGPAQADVPVQDGPELQVIHRLDDAYGNATWVSWYAHQIDVDHPISFSSHGTTIDASISAGGLFSFDLSFRFSNDNLTGAGRVQSQLQQTVEIGEAVTLPQLDGSNVYIKLKGNRALPRPASRTAQAPTSGGQSTALPSK
ncbi:hypothetical protein [Achromobacter insuavis]|uniref:hypothetical protein n=1 Tax=Achromobacter insuavis TaxID=1287735 RepID=UPI001F130FFF|nr:hypothetical protein [Achromobacter insuavis]